MITTEKWLAYGLRWLPWASVRLYEIASEIKDEYPDLSSELMQIWNLMRDFVEKYTPS